ncbi:MAG: hypothetical protein AAF228_06260 [Pseudomonadota bacterium]
MSDKFQNFSSSLLAPASEAFTITPNDTTDLSLVTRALYIGTAGNIVVVMKSGSEVTFNNIPSGTVLSLRTTRIKATGTTATNILGLV